ncbi:helix-turn-helix transcriptional regulator [Variovorax paradoxus]|nr:helix-turn-helix transcriptional regulator [Variovorax paradoxus]
MRKPDLHDFSALLLQLYRLSHELPIQAFQDAALDLIKPVLPFDASMWGTATTASEGIDVRTLHLHQKDPEMMVEYESYKHLDSAAASFFGKGHGTRGFNSARWWSGPKYAPFLDYVRRYDQNNIFITMDSDPRTNFMQWVSLFRADPDAHCKPEEESLLASLSPHLMQALAHNRVMHLDRTLAPAPSTQPRGAAIADLHGAIYHCDVTFIALVQEEFAGWTRQALPQSLLEHFMTAQSTYLGRHAVMSYRLEQRLLFLRVRKRCRADGLTPREHTVAGLLARGDTHKDIAAILSRSPATVRNHIQSIYDKLQVGNVAGLIHELQLAG